jgi:hypothetical protein
MNLSIRDAVAGLYGPDSDTSVACDRFITEFREANYAQYLADFLELFSSSDIRFVCVAATYLCPRLELVDFLALSPFSPVSVRNSLPFFLKC